MSLIDKFANEEKPNIEIHETSWAFREYLDGHVTKTQIKNKMETLYALTPEEKTKLDDFFTKIDTAAFTPEEMEVVVGLTQKGYYTKAIMLSRLDNITQD